MALGGSVGAGALPVRAPIRTALAAKGPAPGRSTKEALSLPEVCADLAAATIDAADGLDGLPEVADFLRPVALAG